MSERCNSASSKQDAGHERRSKQKHDKAPAEQEAEKVAEQEAEQEAESEHVSDTEVSQKRKDIMVSLNEKGWSSDEASGKKASNSNFPKIYTYEDEKKVLKALLKSGQRSGSMAFWLRVKDSLKLSIPVSRSQLYEKIRRLKGSYISAYKKRNKSAMSPQDRRLYNLSHKIWKTEARLSRKQQQQEADGYGEKLHKLVRELHHHVNFPVADSLEAVPASRRPRLQSKWNHFNALELNLFIQRIDLIRETLAALIH